MVKRKQFNYEFANPADLPKYIAESYTNVLCAMRRDPSSDNLPARHYFDNMIAEGMVRIEFPKKAKCREDVTICTVTVGLDEPIAGIRSPLKSYNEISKIVRNLCKEKICICKTKCLVSQAAIDEYELKSSGLAADS